MPDRQNRLVLAVPGYGNTPFLWVQKWLAFQSQIAAHSKHYAGLLTTETPYIDAAMNSLVVGALRNPEWDYIVFLEHDNLAPEGWVERLLSLDPERHKIVGCLYFGKAAQDMRPIPGHVDKRTGEFERLTHKEVLEMLMQPGLHPVDVVGMGATAIHRSVFEDWKPPRGYSQGRKAGRKRVDWFQRGVRKNGFLGHDVGFCMAAAEQGIQVWCDSAYIAGHIGTWVSDVKSYLATMDHLQREKAAVETSIPTAMTAAELAHLAELAKGKVVLEIGSRLGASTIAMAREDGAERVYALDWHQGDVWHEAVGSTGDTLEVFWRFVGNYGLKGKIVPLVGRSDVVLPTLRPCSFDLVFVDGDHSYEGVRTDIQMARTLLKPGGRMVFHDYRREDKFEAGNLPGELELGVTKAVDEAFERIEEVFETLAVVRPSWPPPYSSLHLGVLDGANAANAATIPVPIGVGPG